VSNLKGLEFKAGLGLFFSHLDIESLKKSNSIHQTFQGKWQSIIKPWVNKEKIKPKAYSKK